MKSISKIYKKFININIEKKQITFALFALFLYLFFRKELDPSIAYSAIPAAVAAGAKIAASAAAKGAAIGAGKGAVEGAVNKGEDESTLGAATKGAAKGAASGALTAGKDAALGYAKDAYNAKKGADTINNMPKPNPNPTTPTPIGTSGEELNKSKDESSSTADKDKEKNKNDKILPKESQDDGEGDIGLDEASTIITKKSNKKFAGCLIIIMPLILIFGLPVLIFSEVVGVTSTMGNISCEDSESTICIDDSEDASLFEKIKNFVLYGSFASNAEAIADKVEEVYDEIYEKYNVKIDIPLLLSTVMADSETQKDDVDSETKELVVSKTMKERIDSLMKFGELQVSTESIYVVCKMKTENDIVTYYTDTDIQNIDEINVIEGNCNQENVGKTIKMTVNSEAIDGYYTKLEGESELLGKIYGEDAVKTDIDLNLLIQKIKLKKELFTLLYGGRKINDEACAGAVPLNLFYDSSINIRTPLNGNYTITSPYGYRTPVYKDGNAITNPGFHNGIDAVSNDLTLVASGDGVIIEASANFTGSNNVKIRHTASDGSTYTSTYGHLKSFLVSVGDTVKSGDPIGIMGTTGISTGVHLHFSFYDEQSREYINPLNLFTKATNYEEICS